LRPRLPNLAIAIFITSGEGVLRDITSAGIGYWFGRPALIRVIGLDSEYLAFHSE